MKLKHSINTFQQYLQLHNESIVDEVGSWGKLLTEMAMPKDVAKRGLNFDRDDLEFLQQFDDPTIWADVLHQRWQMLFDALDKRFKQRQPDYERIKKAVREAILTKDYSGLKEFSPELQREVEQWGQGHSQRHRDPGDNKAIKDANEIAKYLTYFEVERMHPHAPAISDEGLPEDERRFTVREGGRVSRKKKTYIAKPHLNRLMHKLERTEGQPHLPGSGLEGQKGQYGYDLYDPLKGHRYKPAKPKREDFESDAEYKKALKKASHVQERPDSTRGMTMPTRRLLGRKLALFMAHNAHQMYGTFPEQEVVTRGEDEVHTRAKDGQEYVWKKLPQSFKTDQWVIKNFKDKLTNKWFGILNNPEPGSVTLDGEAVPVQDLDTTAKKYKWARKLANQEIKQMAEAGELRTPPNPMHPNGVPIEVSFGSDGQIKADFAPIYLPWKKIKYRVEENGRVVEKEGLTPVVKEALFLRRWYDDPEDPEEVDPSELLGHDKSFRAVDASEFSKEKGDISSAMYPNQNTAGRQHMSELDPRFGERWAFLEEEMGKVGLDRFNKPTKKQGEGETYGEYYGDIIKGIWACIKNACGGMTNHDVEIMKGKVPDLHQLVVMKMRQNLRNPMLDTEKGRVQFAVNVTSSFAQQDQGKGGGTRKLRRLTQGARDRSMDDTGGEGGDLSVQDAVTAQMAEGGSASQRTDGKSLERGQKSLPAGRFEWSYDLDNFRKWIKHAEDEAEQSDKDKAMSQDAISSMAQDLFERGMDGGMVVHARLKVLAKQIFLAMGLPENEAEQKSNSKIAKWSTGQPSSSEMVSRFKSDPEMMDFIEGRVKTSDIEAEKQERISNAQKIELDEFRQFVQSNGIDAKISEPGIQQHMRNYVRSTYPDNQFIHDELERMISGSTGEQPQAQAAKEISPQEAISAQDEAIIRELLRQERWYEAAMNKTFRAKAPLRWLQGILAKLKEKTANPGPGDPYTKKHYEIAQAWVNAAIAMKQRQQQ
jgi:hypothetical protein